jgi:hypothetical protein
MLGGSAPSAKQTHTQQNTTDIMNTTIRLALVSLCTATLLSCAGCMTQEARTSRVERRQDRMDGRFEGRMDRREIRAEREDARYDRWWDATMN